MDAESENAEREGTRMERETCFQTLHLMRINERTVRTFNVK
jgi:hypothetical protein